MAQLNAKDMVVQFWDYLNDESDDADNEIMDILGAVHETEVSESSSSSDDSDSEQEKHVCCKDFLLTIDQYSDNDFRSHLRLRRATVQYLIERYKEIHPPKNNPGTPKSSPKLMMYMYLWYISNTVTYRQLANLFGVTKSTAWLIVNRVVAWILTMGNEFVVWPSGEALVSTCKKFYLKKKIPGVVGAIDCTHISINAPPKEKSAYFNRKRTYSIVLQAVVDADKKFIDICCGEPGSLHDSRVLRRSELYRQAETSNSNAFPNGTFLLADSAYPCKNWIVPAFKDYGSMTREQKRFNYIHSSTRIVVENAFALLKGRFRRLLKFTEHKDIHIVTRIIMSICIVHNICIIKDDVALSDEVLSCSDVIEDLVDGNNDPENENRRETLLRQLINQRVI